MVYIEEWNGKTSGHLSLLTADLVKNKLSKYLISNFSSYMI